LDKVRLKGIDMAEAQFKVAICAFHQNKLDETDVELFQLRMTRSAPDEPRNTTLRRILSVYLFAEICFQRNRMEEAHKYCRKALSMKRKLLGPTNWLETNCFSLLSVISAAQGDSITAEVYQDKAKASDSPDSSLEQNPEIRATRIDALVSSRRGVGVDVKNIKILSVLPSFISL
jgi:tetratricopeptide (TPR) repeat protein